VDVWLAQQPPKHHNLIHLDRTTKLFSQLFIHSLVDIQIGLIAVTYDCMIVYMIGENKIQTTFSHAQLKHLHVLVEWSLQWGVHPHHNQSSLTWA
jgi:hypothetical protein